MKNLDSWSWCRLANQYWKFLILSEILRNEEKIIIYRYLMIKTNLNKREYKFYSMYTKATHVHYLDRLPRQESEWVLINFFPSAKEGKNWKGKFAIVHRSDPSAVSLRNSSPKQARKEIHRERIIKEKSFNETPVNNYFCTFSLQFRFDSVRAVRKV